jgi:hypothetical protein
VQSEISAGSKGSPRGENGCTPRAGVRVGGVWDVWQVLDRTYRSHRRREKPVMNPFISILGLPLTAAVVGVAPAPGPV